MNHRLIGLALTSALVLAACGGAPQHAVGNSKTGNVGGNPGGGSGGGGGGGTTPAANDCATLTVDMTGGPTLASVALMQNGAVMRQVQVSADAKTFKVPAGSYTVSGNVNGYALNSPASVTLACGETKVAALDFRTAVATQVAAIGADLDQNGKLDDKAFADALGDPMDYQRESNLNKNALLLAAQTEEAVNVTMIARDAAGSPVPGALVRVTADSDSVSIFPGHVMGERAAATAGAVRAQGASSAAGEIVADASGVVRFHVYAFSGVREGAPPVRFAVNANGGAGSTPSANTEFKVFFANMSHLYYSGNTNFGASGLIDSGRRVGGNVGSFENNFIDPAQRTHTFTTVAYDKQPQAGPFPVGTGGENTRYPGYVEYSVSGASASRVHLVSGGDSGATVRSRGGSVSLVANDDVQAADLPLNVTVTARYFYEVTFGSTTYDFLLKSYLFNKSFTGTILQVTKSGPDILTWTGYDRAAPNPHDAYAPDDITIPQTLDPGGITGTHYDDISVGKQYPYTITVKNVGGAPARNLVIRDVLPAELGYVLGSAQLLDNSGNVIPGSGIEATYNAQLHAVNISFTATASLRDLPAGQSLSVRLLVYPRQKPGYAFSRNGDAFDGHVNNAYGQNAPRAGTYADPYMISNRAKAVADNANEVNDYKNIYVVRPIATLTKSGPASVGNNRRARFDITLRNIDRASEDADAGVRAAYADLKNRFGSQYPNEGFLYMPRLVDVYGGQLDFINAYDANGTRVDVTEATGKNSFSLGVPVEGGRLLNGTSYSLGADFQVEDSVGNGGANNYRNCAYGYAWNLNQPDDRVLSNSIQYEGLLGNKTPAPNVAQGSGGHYIDDGSIDLAGRNLLAACATVGVTSSPSFAIGLQDYDQGGNVLGDDNTIPQGSTFSYVLNDVNESRGDAHNVRIATTSPSMAQLQSVRVVYNAQSFTISLDNTSGSVAVDGDTTISYTRSGNTVNFNVSTFNTRDSFTATFSEYAAQAGEGKFRSTLDWNENVTGAPVVEEEYTKVAQR